MPRRAEHSEVRRRQHQLEQQLLPLGQSLVLMPDQLAVIVDKADGGIAQREQNRQRQRDQALLFQKFEVALYAIPLKSGGHHGAQAVHAAHQQREHVEFRRFQINGRQDDIVVRRRKDQRHRQIQHRAAKGGADGLTGLGGMALPAEGILTPEALKIGIIPVGVHRVLLSVFEGVSRLRREESFALRGETLLATAPKVSKRAA